MQAHNAPKEPKLRTGELEKEIEQIKIEEINSTAAFPQQTIRDGKTIKLLKLDGTEETRLDERHLAPASKTGGHLDDIPGKGVVLEEVGHGFFLDQDRLKRNEKLGHKLEDAIIKKIAGKHGVMTIAAKLMELIEGVEVLKERKNAKGEITHHYVYREKPDLNAIKYALDRVIGTPQKQANKADEDRKNIKAMSDIIKDHGGNLNKKDDDPKKE